MIKINYSKVKRRGKNIYSFLSGGGLPLPPPPSHLRKNLPGIEVLFERGGVRGVEGEGFRGTRR